ncbi:nucleoporin [Trichophyton equinum CBS 127.97]|uniref:Nucleoporin NUP188 n=1 Tax=Trichophyton equinum (strain ATCC MYA-4606 / CBS 127.97) TaxID=559882 RepID=F2PN58_TRIEC|nr:nucleoporin [Trichophyton equinum CBS 127.97]
MAPPSDVYFPSLDECFGDSQIISWKTAYLSVARAGDQSKPDKNISDFLSSSTGLRILSNPYSPFPKPSSASKTAFESKTAAIHVTSSKNNSDSDEIKSDALWLSKEAGIDEVSALRIVVLAWQRRRENELLSHFSEEELTSLHDAVGIGRTPHGSYGIEASSILKYAGSQSESPTTLKSKETRQKILFHILLSEQRYILKLAHFLVATSLRDTRQDQQLEQLSGSGDSFIVGPIQLGRAILNGQCGTLKVEKTEINIPNCIEAFRLRVKGLEAGSWWSNSVGPDVLMESSWQASSLEELVQILSLLFLQVRSSEAIPSSDVLLSWLRLMSEYEFLETIRPSTEEQAAICSQLQTLISITTLSFLKLQASSARLDKPELKPTNVPYFLSQKDVGEINEIFLKAAQIGRLTASAAVFSWAVIMYSVGEIALAIKEDRELQQANHAVESFNNSTQFATPSALSEPSIYEEVWEKACNPEFDEDFVRFLVSSAVDRCRLLELIFAMSEQLRSVPRQRGENLVNQWGQLELLDLIRSGVQYLDYIPELVAAVLCIVSEPTQHHCLDKEPKFDDAYDPRAVFLNDDILMEKIFRNAKSRFPYEAANFLKFCRALSGCSLSTEDGLPIICHELESMATYTQAVASGFQGYRSIREDENANYVELITPLDMKEVASAKRDIMETSNELVLANQLSVLPAVTVGQVVSESKPAVIMWHHQYNCLGFLGKWLEQGTNSRGNENAPDDDVAADIIGLLADLVDNAYAISRVNGLESSAKRILEMASDGLDRHADIISVVFNIFERSLQGASAATSGNRNLDLTMSCMHFISSLTKVLPGRVWPALVRSSFLSTNGNGGMLDKIIFSVEASSGDLSFLLSSIRLFESVVDDAITHAALRRTTAKVTSAAYVVEYTAGIPVRSMRTCLLNFVRAMVEIYNSGSGWKHNDIHQQIEINTSLAINFHKILYYVYGTDDTQDPDDKITAVFSSSARYLLNILRPKLNESLPSNPILRIILGGFEAHLPENMVHSTIECSTLVVSTLDLAKILIQVGWLTDAPISALEKQLFSASPVLARLFVLDRRYQLPISTLLELLVSRASAYTDREPPSLLGHLGAESSCRFLDALAKFDRPFGSDDVKVAIWKLVTSIITKRQQWLAVFLLTGCSPRESLKADSDKSAASMKSKPFLEASLDLLSSIASIPPQVAVAALHFIAKAQEHWPWVTPELKKHPNFFTVVTQYITELNIGKLQPYQKCMNIRIAALVVDICTVYLHSAKEARDGSFFKTLIPLVTWLSENAVEVDGYNASLHGNLKRNFEMKYRESKISNIKRTALTQPEFGDEYYYDVPMGNKLFGYDFAWIGKRDQGFVEEVKRANLNLSLVEAQMSLLHSWKFFAIEHCSDFMPDREVQKSMARVVRHCLVANSHDIPDEQIFFKLLETRAEFALALVHRLVEVQARGSEVFSLLSVTWDTIRLRNPTYESALLHDNTEYYGLLLNVLFLTLQFHVTGANLVNPEAVSQKPEVSSDLTVVVDVIKNVVANGYRSLCTHLHDSPEKCTPKDFAILTAILQTSLKVKDVDRIYEQIAFHLADSDTIRYAATLFSWSNQLTIEGDPVYGEISMLYLLELSCIPSIAEQLAVDGILVKLSTYRLTEAFRQPQGCGPFDPTPRLFSIWNSGFLPLCLNLLYHIGRTVPEVAAFLNQFDGQLRRASTGFSLGNPTAIPSSSLAMSHHSKYLSLGMATEACSLALISMIIQKFRDAGPSAGVDPQNIQDLKWDRAQVKDDIDALLEKRSVLRSRITPTNEKEAAWAQRPPLNPSSGAENLLEEKIVKELQTAIACMGAGSDD